MGSQQQDSTPEHENIQEEVQEDNAEIDNPTNTDTNLEEQQPPTPELVEDQLETENNDKSVEDPQTPEIVETTENASVPNVSIPVEDYQPALEIISAEKSDEIAIVPDKTPKAVVDLVEEDDKEEKPINLDEDDEPVRQPMSPQFSAEPFDSEMPQFSAKPFEEEKPASPSTQNIALGSLQPMKKSQEDEIQEIQSDQGFSEFRPKTPEIIEDPERVKAYEDFKAGKISKSKLKKIKAKLAKKQKKQKDAEYFPKNLKADSQTKARRKGQMNVEIDYIVKTDDADDVNFAAEM